MPLPTVKFPSTLGDIIIVHVNQRKPREWYVVSLSVTPFFEHRRPPLTTRSRMRPTYTIE